MDDAESAYRETTERGAQGVREPEVLRDEHGEVRISAIATYGDTIHSFRRAEAIIAACFCRAMSAVDGPDAVARPVGLKYIDHMVGNVGWGEMNRWVEFYRDVMGFRLYQHFDDKDISTEYSALMSKVMANGNERVKFPINEPAEGKRKSQIEEYLEYLSRPGRAAHRHGDRRHHRDGREAARSGRRVSARARHVLRGARTARGQDR